MLSITHKGFLFCYTGKMISKLSQRNTLACFSPLVMILTFTIEMILALYTLWRYRLTPVSRLVILILLALATFQLAEYNICEASFGMSSLDWARVGFVAITLLPPLGVHLSLEMAKKTRAQRKLLIVLYAVAAVFAGAFLTVGHGMQDGAVCLGNYAIFEVAPTTIRMYSAYYYGLLLLGIWIALQNAHTQQTKTKRLAQYGMVAGYLVFLLPTTTVNVLDPETISGIPSIMCGFAVLLAITLVGYVLPMYYSEPEDTA